MISDWESIFKCFNMATLRWEHRVDLKGTLNELLGVGGLIPNGAIGGKVVF